MVRVILAAWLLAFAGHAASAEKRVALVIGNSSYEIAPALSNPRNDASDIAAALKRLNFEVTLGLDLTVAQFDNSVDAFTAAAKDADVALFFYSGHGVQIDKRGYLAPVNVKIESESSALRELVAIQEVVSRVENAAKVSVVVLDACRDSPLQERLRRVALDKNKDLVPPKGLPPVSVVGSNTLIVYATVSGETASDGAGRNSPFTGSLLKHIETPGLAVEIMFARVTADVLKKTGGKQQPERYSRLQTELVLNSPQQALASQTPAGPQPPMSEAARAWGDIKDLKEISVFEAFRKQYGQANTLYDTLASQRIEELKRQQVAINVPKAEAGRRAEDACEDGLFVSVAQPAARPCIKPGSGESFKDCPDCPEMVVVPAGSFTMGSPESEPKRSSAEGPQHEVRIAKPFAVGRFAVTRDEFETFVKDSGHSLDRGCRIWTGSEEQDSAGSFRSPGFAQTGSHPVVCVNWNDARAYVQWLSGKTGKSYRLLTEAEREYAARAGRQTAFWWGSSISTGQANYNGNGTYAGSAKGEYRQKTLPVKSFQPNPWGLYQVHGNVWDWVEDCWVGNYNEALADGSALTTGDCTSRVLRGGAWSSSPRVLRAACRDKYDPAIRYFALGLRVARTLTP